MDLRMTDKEREDYLSRPLLARIATVTPGGRPHIAPMWFLYEDHVLYITTPITTRKVKNIQSNPDVAVSIDSSDEAEGTKGIILRGKAELDRSHWRELSEKTFIKYLGSLDHPMAKELLSMPVERTVIVLKPEKITTWDYSKMRA